MNFKIIFRIFIFFSFISSVCIAEGLVEKGKTLYTTKACSACHSLDGSKLVGPTFKGLYMKKGEHSGGAYTADENYLKKSILEPNANIVKGYAPAMPKMPLTDAEVQDLIAFIKSNK